MNNQPKTTRIAFETLGCKLNQAETEFLAKQFTEAGYQLVSPTDNPDVYILNTCTVTHIADRKARHLLRLAHRRNPSAVLVATGCYTQRAPKELSRLEGVSFVLDNSEKPQLLQLLRESGCLSKLSQVSITSQNSRTRSFIKVQDGCNSFCTYCIVPFVRGREKSIPVDQVIEEVKQRIRNGYKEVVLTGTEIGSYNHNSINLRELLEQILSQTEVARLRLSSLQPQEISPELIGLWRDKRLCRHFHLSLQSGSDSVLYRMKRRYITSDYQQAVSLIRDIVPDVAITTDIIVGFPGESEQMLTLAKETAQNFRQQFLGKTMTVLWEKKSNGIWSGLTDNYVKVFAKSKDNLTNKLLPVNIKELWKDGVWGEPTE